MKAAIEGFRYDTDRAYLVGEHDAYGGSAQSTEDMHHWRAGLYVTPRARRYFLAGEGGSLTRFCPPGQARGYKIIPLTEAQAFEWAQRYLHYKTVAEHFPNHIS